MNHQRAREQYDRTRRTAASGGFRCVSGGHAKRAKKKSIGASQAHEVRRLEPVGCPVLGTDRHIYRMFYRTHIPRTPNRQHEQLEGNRVRGRPADKTELPSWWKENVSEHMDRRKRFGPSRELNKAAVALRADRTDYENWWLRQRVRDELPEARAEFILRGRRVAWFCTFTDRGWRPHVEALQKKVSWFMRKQVHYANFAYDFSSENAIEYSMHFERGECPCGEHRWHVHVLIYDNPRMTHAFLAKWKEWWEDLFGWCKIGPPDNESKVVRYCAGYAAKQADFVESDTVKDNQEYEERSVSAEGPRSTFCPCRKCGKVSECTCPHADQMPLFSDASSRVPPYKSMRAREDAHSSTYTISNMREDAAREGMTLFVGPSRDARSAVTHSKRRERFLRYRRRWREERQRLHEQQVSPRS